MDPKLILAIHKWMRHGPFHCEQCREFVLGVDLPEWIQPLWFTEDKVFSLTTGREFDPMQHLVGVADDGSGWSGDTTPLAASIRNRRGAAHSKQQRPRRNAAREQMRGQAGAGAHKWRSGRA